MLGLSSPPKCQVSPAVFGQLCQLLQNFAHTLPDAWVLTDQELQSPFPHQFQHLGEAPKIDQAFCLVWSTPFKVLLGGHLPSDWSLPEPTTELRPTTEFQSTPQALTLTFQGEEIVRFCHYLGQIHPHHPEIQQFHVRLQGAEIPNDPQIQNQFTLALIATLTDSSPSFVSPEGLYPAVSPCQPIDQALQRRVNQDRLLTQVLAQIRHSLELPVILTTAIEAVRQSLGVGRGLIYRFQPNFELSPTVNSPDIQVLSSQHYQAFESLAPSFPSLIAAQPSPLLHLRQEWSHYAQGVTVMVSDIEVTYAKSPPLLQAMQDWQVRAWMATPIWSQKRLWGLIVLHQCDRPRPWDQGEQESLMQVAEHLTVAITQAQHHQQLQQQKQTLEQQVAEYTQELQEVLMATQVANRAKNEFLATMSHELRTPLACVIGMSSTLLHWSFGSLNQRQRDYLQTIHDSGEHLLEIINDILQVSELEAGKTTLNLSQFPLSRLAYNCERMFREKARMGNLELKVEVYLQPNQDLFRGDARRIQQIIMNLLSNGIKFTPPQGKVTLRLWREGKVAVWQVEDTGIGIAPEQHGLLFQKFQQLDTSIRREYSGTGLGLALTKQFVDLHQGQIELESEVGQGAKFTVRLPCQVLPIVKPMVNNSGIEHFPAQGQIILLEDDEETATLICELLTAVGYQVVWLVDASTAIDQIEFLKPVAIVVDLNLSGMGNHDIITRFRQLVDMDHLKIVALGLETTITQVKRHSPPFQADLYLCKPLEPNQLITSITSLTAPEWDGAS